ncbi:hypothetical protein FB567DRAFT_230242 [Paraphoma chrysanthemicola]|uniref:Uncharacterized protein n=1 Tax=Paraphoma chrysanthemicola TaxID=798071 RepID=A0A8K0RG08_9PLEO|nr:hypothetical protein FB567DRAFT_230242 [Paraphoma chrysanthemicola]
MTGTKAGEEIPHLFLTLQQRCLAFTLLFYGCRAPSSDVLYADLLKRWEQLGAVSGLHFLASPKVEGNGNMCRIECTMIGAKLSSRLMRTESSTY